MPRKATTVTIPGPVRRSALAALVLLLAPAVAAAEAPQRELALTLYRQDVAAVHDRRTRELAAGEGTLGWPRVVDSLQLDTVRLHGDGVALLGHAREHRPMTTRALLQAHVDRPVKVVRRRDGERRLVRGTLRSAEPPLVDTADGLETVDPARLVFPGVLPEGLGAPPALTLEVASEGDGPRALTLSYLAEGLSWSADYIATLSADGERLDLEARATLANGTDTDLEEARVELVAGTLNVPRADAPSPRVLQAARAEVAAADTAAEPAGDYQRYALDGSVTLDAGARRSVRLFRRADIAVERAYVLAGGARGYRQRGTGGGWEPAPLETRLGWTVAGGPLPAGTVRVHDAGEAGRFLGGDTIADRPEGSRVELVPGRPFDVTARRRQTDFARIDERVHEAAHEIRLANAREQAVEVRVEEAIPGDWRITEASHRWQRAAAGMAVWTLEVPAGGEARLRYRVRVTR